MSELLKNIAVVGAGQGAPQGKENYCDEGTPFIKAGNLQELIEGKNINFIQKVSEEVVRKYKLKKYPKGTILFAKSGMSCMKGYVYVLPQEACVVSHLACITPKLEVSDYLRYYFLFNKPNTLVKDVSYPSISLQDIGELKINIKTDLERNKIVRTLKCIENNISMRKNELRKYDELIKARFIEMFGSTHNSKTFVYYPLNEITTVCSGGTPNRDNKAYWESGTIPWVKTTELKNNRLTHVEEFITELGLEESSAKLVPSDTVLIAMYGQGKTRGMTGYLEIEATTNQACACILPTNKMNMIYLWKYFELSYDKLRELAKGGNQPNLNCTMIRDFKILVPPIELQNQYADFVQQVDKSRFDIKKSITELEREVVYD